MRHWKRGLVAAVSFALLLGLMTPAFGAAGSVNQMAVNDQVLETTPENMPRIVGDVLYVPYTMLSNQVISGTNLGVNALHSTTRRRVLVTDGGRKGVIFDTQANTAEDMDGNPVSARAMVRNSTVFVPIDWLCEYFGTISCSRIPTPYGTVIRVTSAAAILNDKDFADAATNQLAGVLRRFLDAGGLGEGNDPAPSDEVPVVEPTSGAELYLACRWGSEAKDCAHLAEGRGLRALFLFAPEEIAGQDDLIRGLAGAGHTLGLVLDGDGVEECLAQALEGRRLMAAAARYNILVVSAPGLDKEGREALAQAGYVVWSATALGKDFSSGSALVRGLDSHRINFVEMECGTGGTAFLRSALNNMEEESCQIYLATAPALS